MNEEYLKDHREAEAHSSYCNHQGKVAMNKGVGQRLLAAGCNNKYILSIFLLKNLLL